jgi:hypothetical protein
MSKKQFITVLGFFFVGFLRLTTSTALPQGKPENGVVLRLLIPNPKSCAPSEEISAEVVLRNQTPATVTVPLSGIGSGIHYSSHSQGDIHSPGVATLNVNADPWPARARPPKEITLRSGESYWLTARLALDRDFFSKPGIYDVSIDPPASSRNSHAFVGLSESNKVYFEVEDCNPGKTK